MTVHPFHVPFSKDRWELYNVEDDLNQLHDVAGERPDTDGLSAQEVCGLRQFAGFLPFEGIDVGIDRRSPVSWALYERHGAFAYSGLFGCVTYAPGELAPDAGPALLAHLRELGLRME